MTKFVLYASLMFGIVPISEAVAQSKPQTRSVDRAWCEEQYKIAQEVGSRRPRAAPPFFEGAEAGFRACLQGRDFKAGFVRARQKAEAESQERISRARAEARVRSRGRAVVSQQAQAAAPVPLALGDDADPYCAQRFRSYDPASGTYLGYDGIRHPCP
jgi:hypothetical protein